MGHTIGGNVTVKNCIDWDACFEQCIRSLLPVCDEINVVDSDSSDGTTEAIKEMCRAEPKIRLLNYPWPNERGDKDCIIKKMNWSRERLTSHYHLHLESDEVLGEESYRFIRESAERPDVVLGMFRHNFWEDARHELAPGYILSPHVIRFAPKAYYLGGDCHHPLATQTEPAVNWNAIHHCHIYHYGFLRKPRSYLEKYENLMLAINGSVRADPDFHNRFKKSMDAGTNWMKDYGFPTVAFNGKHPAEMVNWIGDRGYA